MATGKSPEVLLILTYSWSGEALRTKRLLLIDANCAINYYVWSRITYKNIPKWYIDIVRICGENIPIVVVGIKVDEKNEKS